MRKWVLWGHQFSEYKEMFDLPADLAQQKILEFACGPTTVNQELTKQGMDVLSCDPWFESNIEVMRENFESHFQLQLQRMQAHPEAFNLKQYGGLETFVHQRQNGFNEFFKDFPGGFQQKRYVGVPQNQLPFENQRFDKALCANFLFADLSDQDLDFHLYWISEMLRVAHDVRIYPLTNKYGQPSALLGPVLLALNQQGIQVTVQDVPFRVVPESMAMLKLHSGKCDLA